MRELPQTFWDAIDEMPRTSRTLMVPDRQGETRHVPISALASLGRIEQRSRHPETERRAQWLKLTGYLLDKEDDEPR